jgi:hypothetical protein
VNDRNGLECNPFCRSGVLRDQRNILGEYALTCSGQTAVKLFASTPEQDRFGLTRCLVSAF